MNLLGLPPAASAHAAGVDQTMVLVHALMAVLFVGWTIFFSYVLIRFRRSAHRDASYHGLRGRWSTVIEGAVLVAEGALLVFFSIPLWSARVDAFPPETQSTVVRVVAEQFAWNVHYPGADGRFGRTTPSLLGPSNPLGLDRADPAGRDDITTINQLNLPVNRPVIVQLRAAADAREAGRHPRDCAAGLVYADRDRAVGDCLLATMRPWSLQDARLLHDPVAA